MRVLSLLTAAAVASAVPISVVVSSGEIATWRIGHPAMGVGMTRVEMVQPPSRMGRLCHKMQSSVSRIFAMAGLGPVIPSAAAFAKNVPQAFPQGTPTHLPVDPIYTSPPIWQKAGTERLGHDHIVPQELPTLEELPPVARPHGHHHHHNFRPYHRHHGSFLRRVHRALMSLGPWEGRAVAFVLGCGIGVLLRMVWVISILTYRAFRGPTGEQDEDEASAEYEQVVLVSEELFVAPPEYTDEKVDRAELDVKV